MKILFICRGNVGRSQMAEFLFNKISDGTHTSSSAGTRVLSKEGESRDGQILKDCSGAKNIIEAMSLIGIDISNNKRTQLTKDILDSCEKAVVMAEEDTIPEYLRQSDKSIYWVVKDPKGMSIEDTVEIRNKIEGLVSKLVENLH